MEILKEIEKRLEEKENNLSIYATKSKDAIRIKEKKEDIRPPFFHDIDTIIYDHSYARYIDKTQVYSFSENDHISRRMLHVQFVSKIARTIGRCLNLNEDLIEAIALGHDIGHTPIGHVGERILDKISMKELNLPFMHNIQSVRTFMTLTNQGKGDNLTIQVLDGIMCHNGEMLENRYKPQKKTKEEFLEDYHNSCNSKSYAAKIRPMTLEGCVVRISDIIAYIGRDVEDAITLKKIKREELPKEIVAVLGNNNKEIINTIILDIVKNSYQKNEIVISKEVFEAVNKLKKFNYQNIYDNANTKKSLAYYEEGMNKLYYSLLDSLNHEDKESSINKNFLNDMDPKYKDNTNPKKMVIDFIAGMTDDYFIEQISKVSVN